MQRVGGLEYAEPNFHFQRRDFLAIIGDMLALLNQSETTKTTMVYRANLNFKRIKRYLDFLVGNGLTEVLRAEGGSERYRITEKGREFLARYRNLAHSLESVKQTLGIASVKRPYPFTVRFGVTGNLSRQRVRTQEIRNDNEYLPR